MSKLLLFGLLGLVVYLLLRGAGRKQRTSSAPMPPEQRMVACARCGLNLPETESLKSGEQYYCCEQHRGLGPLERKR
ncbi:MAG: PP0621 family protein [Sterolibacterium sp.]